MSNDGLKVLLAHGWAGHPALWSRVCQRLDELSSPAPIQFTKVDLGFYGDSSPACEGLFDVAIGHSAGLPWLLEQTRIQFCALVSIAGFTRFCRGKGFSAGWSPRVVERMGNGLANNPVQVLQDFWSKASTDRAGHDNFPLPDARPEPDRLQSALQALSSVDCREQWDQFSGPRRVMAATGDAIVAAEHSQSCFPNDQIEWIKSDSHWIPWTFPETCAALLHETIQHL